MSMIVANPQRSRALPQVQASSPYVAYAYSYPHKTAYRTLRPSRPLDEAWAKEQKNGLFLYIHIPFCEMRCGFCNLFTTANPRNELTNDYIEALHRQADRVRSAIGPVNVARMAIGGGTPTYLSATDLERVLRVASDIYAVAPGTIPISVETSPRTAHAERLAVLKSFGVSRISIGVQSFVEAEVGASGRAQKNEWVASAVERIRDLDFPTLNLDLIYGLPGQTVQSWLLSLQTALRWQPEELYLYPLYVRPLTGLGRHGCEVHDQLRLTCYREGRDMLRSAGYEQVSMRMFRRAGSAAMADPVYCCQDDGMIGLGCGARSYTRALHYSTEYAVGAGGVNEIIRQFVGWSDDEFDHADYGCELDDHDQRRRWLIKSLFRAEGLDRRHYLKTFDADVLRDFPELSSLAHEGYFDITPSEVKPTAAGLEWSDALAPMLFSESVKASMAEFELR